MSSLAVSDRRDAPIFSDGLGERVIAPDGTTGELLQVLRLRPELLGVPSFEFALRERTARLANFRHAYFARARRIDRAMAGGASLSVVSDHTDGVRLSDVLQDVRKRQLRLDTNAALCLIRQLVPAVAVLHENARDVAHGLIAPERLVLTPNARLVVVEHVLGAAIEQLQFSRDRLWQEFRAGLPPTAGQPRFDHRADVNGIGLVSLALLLGRPLEAGDFPHNIPALVSELRDRRAPSEEPAVPAALLGWLMRALQIDPRRSFASAPEAMSALESVWSENPSCVPSPVALETFLSRYLTALLQPPAASAISTPVSASADISAEAHEVQDDAPRGVQQELARIDDALPAAEAPVFEAAEASGGGRRRRMPMMAGAAVIALIAGGWPAVKIFRKPPAPPPQGVLAVQSNPTGVQIFVDGVERGATPARVSLAPGSHILELRGRGVPRVIPFNVSAGAEVSQYLEFADAPVVGQLVVQSEPAGAKVSVDGKDRGVAPLTIADLSPGEHAVVLQAAQATSRHTVVVQAGATVSLVVPLASAPVSGWVAVKAPFTIDVLEAGRSLGTTDTDRIMMAAGRHELEFVSEAMGYRAKRVVQVTAGKVTPFPLDLPQGTINLNATPWAEVWLDGKRVGDTPIGNLAVTIGPHEIVFKNPQLGEKRQAVAVTLIAPIRLSVDMK